MVLIGRRGIGGFYLLNHHPWLVVVALVVVIALVWYLQRRR